MNNKGLVFLIISVLVLILGLGVYASFNNKPRQTEQAISLQKNNEKENEKPPDFTLPKYDGSGDVNLANYYNNKPTIVQFWATWCEFCRREFPVTNAIVAQQKDELNFIAVNFSRESKKQIGDYIKELRLDPGIITFVMDEDGKVGKAYGVTGTPVHIFIKKGGEVSLLRVGYMSPQDMKDEIKNIL